MWLRVGARPHALALLQVALPHGYRLWIGRDITRFEQLERLFFATLFGSALINVLAAGLTGLVAHRALLGRISAINHTTAAIVGGDLRRRLPASGSGDAFDMLASTLNRMLEQIDDLLQNARHSSNAIAHELRTPLAELRADLEHLAVTRPGAAEVHAGIDLAIADIDRVIAIFNAVLRLAEIDSGTRRAGFRSFDARSVIQEAAEFYGPVAEERGIELDMQCAGALAMRGDPLLVAQALGNLIENSLKHAVGCSRLRIEGARNGDALEIVVADNGPGVPAEDRTQVMQRFYRIDRSHALPGAGLGLALVSAVAKLHGGILSLEDNRPGLRAVVRIPAGAAPGVAG